MGAGQSGGLEIGGSSMGYQVLRVYPNSPGSRAGLKAYFDFIVAIGNTRFNKENGSLREILKASVDQKLRMIVYNTRIKRTREVEIVPSTSWGGNGLLGVSIKHSSFDRADERVWHVVEVETGSPAQQAGFIAGQDYVIGSDSILQENDDLYNLVETHEGKALKLFVYNVNNDNCREVICYPNSKWGGKGYLGCEFGHGLLHRIPYSGEDGEPVDNSKASLLRNEHPMASQQPITPQNNNNSYTFQNQLMQRQIEQLQQRSNQPGQQLFQQALFDHKPQAPPAQPQQPQQPQQLQHEHQQQLLQQQQQQLQQQRILLEQQQQQLRQQQQQYQQNLLVQEQQQQQQQRVLQSSGQDSLQQQPHHHQPLLPPLQQQQLSAPPVSTDRQQEPGADQSLAPQHLLPQQPPLLPPTQQLSPPPPPPQQHSNELNQNQSIQQQRQQFLSHQPLLPPPPPLQQPHNLQSQEHPELMHQQKPQQDLQHEFQPPQHHTVPPTQYHQQQQPIPQTPSQHVQQQQIVQPDLQQQQSIAQPDPQQRYLEMAMQPPPSQPLPLPPPQTFAQLASAQFQTQATLQEPPQSNNTTTHNNINNPMRPYGVSAPNEFDLATLAPQ